MSWRPFYWNDLDGDLEDGLASSAEVCLYRVMATIGFGCGVVVVAILVVLLVQEVIR